MLACAYNYFSQGNFVRINEGLTQQGINFFSTLIRSKKIRRINVLQGYFFTINEGKNIDGLRRARMCLLNFVFADDYIVVV